MKQQIIDALGDRVCRRPTPFRLTGTNIVTPIFVCYVEDAEGNVAEVSFAYDMQPLSPDPIFGLTYERLPDGSTNPKDGAYHSIEELVEAVS